MNWLDKLDAHVLSEEPLAPLTWYGLGGPARLLGSPHSTEGLRGLVDFARHEALPIKILGAGANILVRDQGFRGLVIRLDQPAFRSCTFTHDRVFVGAGYDLMQLCNTAVERGLAGLECLAGIPGTIGGAIRMNAGGRFGMISEVITCADILTTDGTVESWSKERLGFGYRKSNLGGGIVLAAELQLRETHRDDLRQSFRECWDYKKQSQPLKARSAGCVFKNPIGMAAAKLIDEAGLKGTRCGGAFVSDRHANFIGADEGATADDVLQLIERIREVVQHRFGTNLELEIDVW